MAGRLVIHPLSRGIRPIMVELLTEAGKVIDVKAGTTYYWDFAGTLRDKNPLDALQLTQRTGGLDFVAHAAAAARALEEIGHAKLSNNTYLSRNILLALDIIYGHITHFYQNVLPDYIPYPQSGPFNPAKGDFRVSAAAGNLMINNMWRAFALRQNIHRMMAILAGKAPHICSIVFGGTTKHLKTDELIKINSYLKELNNFIIDEYSSDVSQIETTYVHYFNIGAGNGNLLSVGEFPWENPTNCLLISGTNFSPTELNKKMISIDCSRSWFNTDGGEEENLASVFKPDPDKTGAYSWIKGAVYDNRPFEVGAVARMTVAGNTAVTGLGPRAQSVLGRYRARLEESKLLVKKISEWLEAIDLMNNTNSSLELPDEGEAIGVAEASSGAVIHYISIKDSLIDRYNVLDSLSWNLCPVTRGGQIGPIAKALLGLKVQGPNVTPDILRVARSF